MEASLSIELTEPVVPLLNGSTSERASRHHDDEISPPAIIRGLLTLKLAKPTKIASIELELQAKATTRCVQGAGPSRLDVTEQYNVHSASTVVFKAAGPAPQAQTRSASARPRVQFLDDSTGSRALHRAGSSHWWAPSDSHPVSRSTSLDPGSLRVTRSLSPWTGNMDVDIGRNYEQPEVVTSDPAPPYPGSDDQHSFSLNAETYISVADRSQSIASSSRSTDPQSSPVRSRSRVTPDIPYRSPASSVLSLREYARSRTSSIEELPELEDNNGESLSGLPPDNVAYYGLSRIATASSGWSSEQDHRGRSRSRFSLGNIVHVFDAVKDRVRSRSPGSLPRRDEEQRGRSLVKGRGKPQVSTYGVRHALHQTGAAEPSVADGANDQSGNGWVVFPQGTYTYPIFFTIPNNSPPTSEAHHGSLIWKIKANVKRPGVFTSKLTAQKEVIVVSLPKHGGPEEGIDLQRTWEDQFQYRVQIAGHAFPIGGKVPFQLTIAPMAKIKVHSVLVYLDERTDYYSRTQSQVRSDVIRRATLLVVRRNNSDERYSEPILPLISDEPDAFRKSPLHRFVGPEENESEAASSFMGPGPWTIRHHLGIPDSCSVLHPSNRVKGSNVMVDHALKIILRVEREDEAVTAGRKKVYDIVIHTPVQILSCRCTSDWTSLPRYDEALQSEGNSTGDMSACPCRTRNQANSRTRLRATDALERVTSRGTTYSGASEAQDMRPSDSLTSRTYLYEQLVSGLVSETGEAPPSYEHLGIASI